MLSTKGLTFGDLGYKYVARLTKASTFEPYQIIRTFYKQVTHPYLGKLI